MPIIFVQQYRAAVGVPTEVYAPEEPGVVNNLRGTVAPVSIQAAALPAAVSYQTDTSLIRVNVQTIRAPAVPEGTIMMIANSIHENIGYTDIDLPIHIEMQTKYENVSYQTADSPIQMTARTIKV